MRLYKTVAIPIAIPMAIPMATRQDNKTTIQQTLLWFTPTTLDIRHEALDTLDIRHTLDTLYQQ